MSSNGDKGVTIRLSGVFSILLLLAQGDDVSKIFASCCHTRHCNIAQDYEAFDHSVCSVCCNTEMVNVRIDM